MINTIFYFVKDLETYRNKLLEEGISSRTIVFVTKERLIMKGGMPFGGMDEDQLKNFIYRTLDGDWLNASIYPYINEQLAQVDLSAVWERINEVGQELSSASSQITLLSSNVENFINAQATRNDGFTEAIGSINARITTVDGKIDAVTAGLTSTIQDVATGLINSAGFVTVATLDSSLAGMFASNSSSKDAPNDCSLETWSDLPIATTDEYPYLWVKIQQKNEQQEVISTSYMRITGEDHTYDSLGMCVDAQYANSSNPTSENIHTTYTLGDGYIRIKPISEAFNGTVDQDHPWHNMTLELATDTDYSFNISKNPATGFAKMIIDVSNNNASKINISADQVHIEGQTIIEYLTSTYFNQEFENRKLEISECKIKINEENQVSVPMKIQVGEGDPDSRIVRYVIDYDGDTPGYSYNGIFKDSITFTNNVLWSSGFHMTGLVSNDEQNPVLSSIEAQAADWIYSGPTFRLGFDPRKRTEEFVQYDPNDVQWSDYIMSDGEIEYDVNTIKDEYQWDARKYTLALRRGRSQGEYIPAGIYCEGDIQIGKQMGCFKGPAIELFNWDSTNEERTDYIDVNSVNTNNIKIGNDEGITQTISIPSTEANKHYDLVIKSGIITGCTLIDETQA